MAAAALRARWRAGSSVVEHLTFNQMAVGSIPSPLTNDFNSLRIFLVSCFACWQPFGCESGAPR